MTELLIVFLVVVIGVAVILSCFYCLLFWFLVKFAGLIMQTFGKS